MFTARLIPAVLVKTGCLHMSLCRHNSGPNSAKELFKHIKTRHIFKSAMKKNFLVLGFRFFWVMS